MPNLYWHGHSCTDFNGGMCRRLKNQYYGQNKIMKSAWRSNPRGGTPFLFVWCFLVLVYWTQTISRIMQWENWSVHQQFSERQLYFGCGNEVDGFYLLKGHSCNQGVKKENRSLLMTHACLCLCTLAHLKKIHEEAESVQICFQTYCCPQQCWISMWMMKGEIKMFINWFIIFCLFQTNGEGKCIYACLLLL